MGPRKITTHHKYNTMKKILKALIELIKSLFGKKKQDGQGGGSGGGSTPSSFKVLCTYGGFNFSNAKEDSSAQIKGLTVKARGMSYSWASATKLKNWGLADGDAGALAVFAVKGSDGQYRGGKFDWISASRVTRSWENIRSGYHGWPKDAIETAKGYAFCIVSKDGKKRTNWILTDKMSKEPDNEVYEEPLTKELD